MNVLDISLERYRKARVWINDSPIDTIDSSSAFIRRFAASKSGNVEPRRVVVEVAVPMGFTMYGLLGGKIEPNVEGFEICVQASSDIGTPYSNALVSADADDIRCGLTDEFVPAVRSAIEECAMRHIDELPNGRLTIDVAACGSVGSNQVVFTKLASILFDALVATTQPTEDSLRQSLNGSF